MSLLQGVAIVFVSKSFNSQKAIIKTICLDSVNYFPPFSHRELSIPFSQIPIMPAASMSNFVKLMMKRIERVWSIFHFLYQKVLLIFLSVFVWLELRRVLVSNT